MRFPGFLTPLVAAVSVFAFAPVASAATTIGSSLADAPNNGTCMSGMIVGDVALPCTIMQTSLAPASTAAGGLAAPASGVIVRWRVRSSTASGTIKVTPRVFTGSVPQRSGNQITLANINAVQEFPARMPISAGQTLGVDVSTSGIMTTAPIINTTAGVGHWNFWSSPVMDGATVTPSDASNEVELLVNADIEPDADNDGWGDETQDQCLGVATENGLCPDVAPILPTPAQAVTNPAISHDLKSLFFSATVEGALKITLDRSVTGRLVKGKCKASARKGKKCTFFKSVKTASVQANAGLNQVNFALLRGLRQLAPGKYRVSFEGTPPTTLNFTVKR